MESSGVNTSLDYDSDEDTSLFEVKESPPLKPKKMESYDFYESPDDDEEKENETPPELARANKTNKVRIFSDDDDEGDNQLDADNDSAESAIADNKPKKVHRLSDVDEYEIEENETPPKLAPANKTNKAWILSDSDNEDVDQPDADNDSAESAIADNKPKKVHSLSDDDEYEIEENETPPKSARAISPNEVYMLDDDDDKHDGHIVEDDSRVSADNAEVYNLSDDDDVQEIPNDKPGTSFKAKKIEPRILLPEIELLDDVPAKRLLGGKMTEERMENVKAVTEEVIQSVHNSINSAPENVPAETPKGVVVDLMRHQKEGLSWLLWREQQRPPSGILADDMGLGKTLSMLSLILEKKNRRLKAEIDETPDEVNARIVMRAKKQADGTRNIIDSHSTLIVAPASLIYQWEKEITDRIKSNSLSVSVFHGPKRQRDCGARALARHDIVITTYQTLSSELSEKRMLIGHTRSDDEDLDTDSPHKKRGRRMDKRVVSKNSLSPLAKIFWERIVLDEAHQIKNRNSLVSKAVCRLKGVHRWCLTGTPIHNELWDLYSLIRFLNVAPFNEEKMWKDFIMTATRHNTERLNTLVKGLLLRRTKEQMCPTTNLPIVAMKERRFELIKLELEGLERHCYNVMFAASKQKVRDILDNQENAMISRRHRKLAEVVKNPFVGGSRQIDLNDRFHQMNYVLVLLLRLRQACVHMSLTRTGVDLDAFSDLGGDMTIDEFKEVEALNILEESLANLSLDRSQLGDDEDENEDDNDDSVVGTREESRRAKKVAKMVERIFDSAYKSTKLKAVLAQLERVIDSNDKCVIVSQWTTMLDMVEKHLKEYRIPYTSITGAVPTKDRQERVNSFNDKHGGAKVMLLSLTAGGVGLNLVGGNHLFLLDLHWNPALEQQACDRIYRMGQEKNVFIHKFLCKKTIEERVLELQDKKLSLAKSVLEGAAKRVKLTMTDIRYLFDLGGKNGL